MKTLATLAAISFCALTGRASDNAWTNSASGYWEDAHWSLGALPGPGQNIYFTNSSWKALAIGASTVQNFPQSLAVQDVYVSSPGTDTANTLLLNYFGLGTPLRANSLAIGTNCNLVMYYSGLDVTNTLSLSGACTHDVGAQVSGGRLTLGDTGDALYTLIDGTLSLSVSLTVGTTNASTFTQQGGLNDCWAIFVQSNSVYNLEGGTLTNVGVYVRPAGTYNQSGGTAVGDQIFSFDGAYIQSGGSLSCPQMYFPGLEFELHVPGSSGTAVQIGGTNNTGQLLVGQVDAAEGVDYGSVPHDHGTYSLSEGVTATLQTQIAGNGTFLQSGGAHIIAGALTNEGSLYYYNGVVNESPRFSNYNLSGGSLTEASLFLGVAATLTQTGGTNTAGLLTVTCPLQTVGAPYHGRYILNAGLLTASNILASGGLSSVVPAEVTQTGGQLVVPNDLCLIWTTLEQTGGSLVNLGRLVLTNAAISVASGRQQLGRLEIHGASSSPCKLTLPSAACAIQLRDSSASGWDSSASLTISNWSGSLYGGGRQQVVFGNSSNALTPGQIAHITFVKPAHLPPGNYPARILASGEIVPDLGSALPTVVSLGRSGSEGLQIGIGGVISNKYAIQISSDLLHWTPWQTQTDLSGMIYVSDSMTNAPQKFYRAVLVP